MLTPGLSRRRLLGLGGTAAVALLATGCAGAVPDLGDLGSGSSGGANCVPRASLDSHRNLAGLPLVYELNRRRSAFAFEPAFFTQLESWAAGLPEVLPDAPAQLWTYGSWTDGGQACDSWHHAGRAFDLSRVRLADRSEVSCRYDRWRTQAGAELDRTRRAYWALAAGLHARFAYVLTYLYDAQHANHIHLDNGRSGNEDSTFSSRSRVQVQAVQALCTYLWDEPVGLSGQWDAASRRAVGRVLDRLGLDDSLNTTASWQGLLRASAQQGRG